MRDRIMLPKVNLSKLSPHGYRRAEYYDERIGLSVCLSVYEHIPGTKCTCLIFTNFYA